MPTVADPPQRGNRPRDVGVAEADGSAVRVGPVDVAEPGAAGSEAAAVTRSGRLAPSASKTSTDCCATIARPDSVTIVGCGTPSSSQTDMIL